MADVGYLAFFITDKRQPLLIGGLRVPLDFAQAGVASNRRNLVHCAPSLNEASRSGLAQPMMFVFGGRAGYVLESQGFRLYPTYLWHLLTSGTLPLSRTAKA
jgi:hypothetical protein